MNITQKCYKTHLNDAFVIIFLDTVYYGKLFFSKVFFSWISMSSLSCVQRFFLK